MNKNLLLICGIALLAIGLLKPNFTNITTPVSSPDKVVVVKPSNEELLDECDKVTKSLKDVSSDTRQQDASRLASLYMDMATLIELSGPDEVIKNTDEIRQANKLSGTMLKLGIRDKYPDLQKAAEALIVASIGDDNVTLDNNLRQSAAEGFRALAWACAEGAK